MSVFVEYSDCCDSQSRQTVHPSSTETPVKSRATNSELFAEKSRWQSRVDNEKNTPKNECVYQNCASVVDRNLRSGIQTGGYCKVSPWHTLRSA